MAKVKIIAIFSAILLLVSIGLLSDTVSGAFSPQLSSTAQTETTVTLSWTKSNDWFFTNYNVTYATSANGPYYQYSIITDQSKTSIAVDELYPNTDYYFIIFDTASAVGTSPSNTLYQKTKSNPTISITSRTQSTVSLQWHDYNTYSSLMPFYSYVVQMKTNTGDWSTLTTISDVAQNTYVVTGLSPAAYNFRMSDKVGDSGQYTSTSDVASVTINTPIQLQITSSVNSINTGQQVQLYAQASGGTNSYYYQWYLDGNAISGATSSSYTFNPTYTGAFTLRATAQDAQDSYLDIASSNSITITVTAAPQPTNQNNQNNNNNGNSNNNNGNSNDGNNNNGANNTAIPIAYIIGIIIVVAAIIAAISIGVVIRHKHKHSDLPPPQ